MKRLFAIIGSVSLVGIGCSSRDAASQSDATGPSTEDELRLNSERIVGAETLAPVPEEAVAPEVTLGKLGAPSATEGPISEVAQRPLGNWALMPERIEERFQSPFGQTGIRTEAPVGASDGSIGDGLLGGAHTAPKESEVGRIRSALAGTTTPAPTFTFSTPTTLRGGHPADAHLSVGFTHVCATARERLGCYTKGGRAVQIHSSSASDVPAETFFSSVITGADGIFDLRTLYDHFRSRFWIAGLTTSSNRVVIAVSKSDNPRNGWNIYWIPATDARAPNNGTNQGVDYPIIGIDSKAFYVGNFVDSEHDCNGDGVVSSGEKCFAYDLVNLRDAQQMADGVPGGSINGWVFWDLTLPDGNLAGITPVVHETSSSRGYLLSNFGADKISLFSINNPLTASQSISRVEVPIAAFGTTGGLTGAQKPNPVGSTPGDNPAPRVKFDNLGNTPLNGHFRSNKIVFTANDSWLVNGTTRAAARVTRFDVTNFGTGSVTVDLDRRFGVASAGDPTGATFDYGWPAAGININGDMAVMTVRTDLSIFPQLRMSAWGSTDTDIRSSILAQAGVAALYPFSGCCNFQAWVDTSGISTDPFDKVGVYFAQEWANQIGFNNYREAIVKEFGSVMPDIAADSLSASQTTIAHGANVTLTIRAVNQGDASMPASIGRWFLSTNNIISTGDTALGSTTFNIASIAVAAVSSNVSQTVTIPSGTAPGTYFIGACLDSGNAASEYRESTNNCNSGAAASPALAPIQVTIN